MNPLESYFREVEAVISRGGTVDALPRSTFYILTISRDLHNMRSWDLQESFYFSSKEAADSALRLRLYEDISSKLKSLYEDFKESGDNWVNGNWEEIAGYFLREKEMYPARLYPGSLWRPIVSEIQNGVRSDTLLNWILKAPYEEVRYFHKNLLFNSQGFHEYRYHITAEQRVLSYPMDNMGLEGIVSKLLKSNQILESQENEKKMISESEDAVRTAIALGAPMNVLPETMIYVVNSYGVYDGKISDDFMTPLFYFGDQISADSASLTYMFMHLSAKGLSTPWHPGGVVDNLEAWCRAGVEWLKYNPYSKLEDFVKEVNDENANELQFSRTVAHKIEKNFTLTYEVLKEAEKGKLLGA